MSSHHVGDTWTLTLGVPATTVAADPSQPLFPAPGPESFFEWQTATGCYSPNNCDIYPIGLEVGIAGLGWWTRGSASAQGTRTISSGVTVTQIDFQFRHHWVSQPFGPDTDIPVTVPTFIQGPQSDGTVNMWWRSGETTGAYAFVGWFVWDIEDIPGIGPILIPSSDPGFNATFIASAQGQITDSSGGVTAVRVRRWRRRSSAWCKAS
jgi:hypothetical protein